MSPDERKDLIDEAKQNGKNGETEPRWVTLLTGADDSGSDESGVDDYIDVDPLELERKWQEAVLLIHLSAV